MIKTRNLKDSPGILSRLKSSNNTTQMVTFKLTEDDSRDLMYLYICVGSKRGENDKIRIIFL